MSNQEVGKVFDEFWGQDRDYLSWDVNAQIELEVLNNEFPDARGKKCVEVGSGTGKVSLRLALRGAKVTLLDISQNALALSRRLFLREEVRGNFIRGSMFLMPFADETFDLVWNVGVLEHFPLEEQQEALAEMARVCKKGGTVLTICPYYWAPIYRFGKWFAERTNRWEFGYEQPVRTLAHQSRPGYLECRKEYTVGFLNQFCWLAGLPGSRYVPRCLLSLIGKLLWRSNYWPFGWLLVSIFTRDTGCGGIEQAGVGSH